MGDEFGCPSFTGGQEDGCTCPGKSVEKSKSPAERPSKFGPIPPYLRQTELFCDAPFDPQCSNGGNDGGNDGGSSGGNGGGNDVDTNSFTPISPFSPVSPFSPFSPVSPVSNPSPFTITAYTQGVSTSFPSSDATTLAVTFIFGAIFLAL